MSQNPLEELFRLPQWVVWKEEAREDGSLTKILYNAVTGTKASSTNPGTWNPALTAVEALNSGRGFAGLGFVLDAKTDPYTVIDFDNKEACPQKQAFHSAIMTWLDSYTERSPSGKGFHVWLKGKIGKGHNYRDCGIELYSQERFLTVTGDCTHKPNQIEEAQEKALDLIAYLEKLKSANRPAIANQAPSEYIQHVSALPETIDDLSVYNMACNAVNGAKFIDLWNGNYGPHYPSQSEADLALFNMLVFYTRNANQVVRLFHMSNLGKRDKAHRIAYINYNLTKAYDRVQAPVEIGEISLEELQAKWAAEGAAAQPLALPAPEPIEAPAPLPATYTPPAAYAFPPGLVGELAQYFYDASPLPVHEASLVAALGVVAGINGRVYQSNGLGLNLYLCFLAGSGVGKNAISTGIGKLISSIPMDKASLCLGPKSFASAGSFDTTFKASACFVSIISEFGKKLKKFTGVNVKSSDEDISAAYLDAFTASTKGYIWSRTARADAKNEGKAITSPSPTLVTESTPHKFYEAINEDNISEGLVSRLLVIEHTGDRAELSETFQSVTPSQDLLQRLQTAVTVNYQNQINERVKHIDINIDSQAKALFKEFTTNQRQYIINQKDDNIKTLWTRAYEKIAKLAGVVAVGVAYGPGAIIDASQMELSQGVAVPTITGPIAQWAINLVIHEITAMTAVYEKGRLGERSDDIECVKKMIEVVTHYITVGPKKFQPENDNRFRNGNPVAMCISNSYLSAYCNTRSFTKHRDGHTRTVVNTARALIDMGKLVEVTGADKASYNTEMRIYRIIG
jgi:hypothetical protein